MRAQEFFEITVELYTFHDVVCVLTIFVLYDKFTCTHVDLWFDFLGHVTALI